MPYALRQYNELTKSMHVHAATQIPQNLEYRANQPAEFTAP